VKLLRWVVLGLVLLLAYPAWLTYRIWEQSHDDEVHTADAIVVLGAAQYNGRPSPVLQARLDQALYLYEEGLSRVIIVTGGKQEGDRFTEAEAGHAYLEDKGVPTESIIEEGGGRTTYESLRQVRSIAEDNEMDSALFVTDPLHSERVKHMAGDLGWEGVYTSYASYERLNRSRATKLRELAREVASLLAYEVFNR
jgi:uncharacterized SAM-binding protein YcdF (DUF218 family)